MLTITTKFNGPTNTKGATIAATINVTNPATGKKMVRRVPYDHAKSLSGNHDHAAHCVAVFAGLTVRQWVKGELDNGTVYTPYTGEVVELGKGAEGRG